MKKIKVIKLYRLLMVNLRSTNILCRGQLEPFPHTAASECDEPCNGSGTKIGSIHQTRAIQETKREDQPDINSSDNLGLLSRCEAVDALIVVLGEGLLDMVVSRLLQIGVRHDDDVVLGTAE